MSKIVSQPTPEDLRSALNEPEKRFGPSPRSEAEVMKEEIIEEVTRLKKIISHGRQTLKDLKAGALATVRGQRLTDIRIVKASAVDYVRGWNDAVESVAKKLEES